MNNVFLNTLMGHMINKIESFLSFSIDLQFNYGQELCEFVKLGFITYNNIVRKNMLYHDVGFNRIPIHI